MAEFAAADPGGPPREGRPGQLLDLHLHQLATAASICARLGREIQRSGTGGNRRPCAGVRIRKDHRQRSLGFEGHGHRLPCRGRQQPWNLARIQKSGLAGVVFHRCTRTRSPSRLWRGFLRTVGNGHPSAAAGLMSFVGASRPPAGPPGSAYRIGRRACSWRRCDRSPTTGRASTTGASARHD